MDIFCQVDTEWSVATGSLLAQTMMLAWLKVKCYRIRNMSPQVKIGMSQVLGHLWLEFEMNSGSDFEKKLVEKGSA
ncbi:transposable element gene [Prunus dulcis]|uniref:Transposable element protein n=1 Tax=Prunus dulcis TaxID=3755 RepID=A0A5H2XMD8_PRUDU|nr:transposable element gene [Prunus dulcis]